MSEVKISEEELHCLKQEIIMAKKLNDDQLRGQMEEAIQRYTGTFVPLIGQNWDILLNEIYPIIQFNLPSIYFKNPRVFLKPRNKRFLVKKRNPITGQMEETWGDSSKSARTQENILNYIIGEIKYKKEVQKLLLDALLLKFGVLWHGYKGNFGMTDEQSLFIKDEQVFVKRISPLRFLKDPAVTLSNLDEGRWIARSFDVPLIDLQEDPEIKVDAHLKGKVGFGDRIYSGSGATMNGMDIMRPATVPLLDFTDNTYQKSVRSRFVEVIEVFMRPSPKEKREGQKGKVILLTLEQKNPLRKPNAWPYKAEGWPAKILEFNPLNDSQFGMPDLDAYKTIADQKNAIVNLQLRNAQENSKVWVAIATEGIQGEEDLEVIRNGDQTIIMFQGDNVQGRMSVASPSGQASSELYLIDQRIQKNLEDKSFVTDLKRGFLQSGEESAASVKIRAAGGSVRPAYRQDIMADFLKDSFGFLNQLNKQFYTVDEAVRINGSLDIEWSENPSKEEIQADVDVELDVISMLPENPETEIKNLQAVLGLMIQGITEPAVAQKLAQEGKTINISPVIENLLMRLKIRDPEIFRNIKPEESQGFVAVSEVRNAKSNVESILSGNPNIPAPPAQGQDHSAHLEIYTTILQLIRDIGQTQASMQLEQLIAIHQQLLQEEMDKEGPEINSPLKKPAEYAQVLS